ncbi:hypothetical protein V9K67_20370 [Paraflavisolibacter sp. H34]|uniref:hypothetical protein n=1 Tax=Huijunlia imazamoxiresistens TaxID=3127457 RepID=UPI003016E60A
MKDHAHIYFSRSKYPGGTESGEQSFPLVKNGHIFRKQERESGKAPLLSKNLPAQPVARTENIAAHRAVFTPIGIDFLPL